MKHIKKHIFRALSAITVPMGIVLAAAQPAGALATVSPSSATLVAQGAATQVSVIGTCDAGNTAFVNVMLNQRSGGGIAQGTGSAEASCTGSPQTFEVFVTANDKPFHKGTAFASATLANCSSAGCETANVQQTITITK